jgi:hypothetical protein
MVESSIWELYFNIKFLLYEFQQFNAGILVE